ncbi:iron chelate uptake ABC transporter family permease subunit [Cupriavidus basilensis]
MPIPRAQLVHVLLSPDAEGEAAVWRNVLTEVRLPRLVLAVTVGGALALSGAVMQALFRNLLAEPGLIGISPSGCGRCGRRDRAGRRGAPWRSRRRPSPASLAATALAYRARQPACRHRQPAARGRGHQRHLRKRRRLLYLPGKRHAASAT